MALARRPHVARKANRELLATAEAFLSALAPDGSTRVKLGVSVFRRTPGRDTFEARGFVSWLPDDALTALIHALKL